MKDDAKLLTFGTCSFAALAVLVAARQPTAIQDPPEQKPVQTPQPEQKPPALPIPVRITGKTLTRFDELKWTPMREIEGAQQAVLWGDPAKGAHSVLYTWPAGAKLAEHSHTFGFRGMVVAGTLTIAIDGGTAKELPEGSFFSLEGGSKHTESVDSSAPCMFYVEREGGFDLTPAK